MCILRGCLMLGGIMAVLGLRVSAATLYVSPSGGHVPPFSSWAGAATNIQAAVDAAVAGDTVLVGDGVYDSGVRTGNRVSIDKAITVQSVNGPQHASIAGEPHVRVVQVLPGATLSGFTIERGSSDNVGGGVYLAGGTLLNCVVRSNWMNYVTSLDSMRGGGVYILGGGVVDRCEIVYNGAYYGGNIFMEEGTVRNSLIRGGYAADYRGGGIYMYSFSGMVEHCTVVGNGGGGVQGYGGTIENCIIVSNVIQSGALANSGASGTYRHTCSKPAPVGTGSLNNLDVEPRFVSYSAGDFHLTTNSLCVDAGRMLAHIVSDLDGAPRPLDGNGDGVVAWDLGAYELTSVHHVSASGAHRPPFASWADAATNIQAAVDAAVAGDTVLVGDGVYDTGSRISVGEGCTRSNRLVVDKAITVKSLNGPQHTSMVGEPHVRCVQVLSGAMLSGFMIEGGNAGETYPGTGFGIPADSMGGGVYLAGGTLLNCVVRSNWVSYVTATNDMQGGGVYVREGGAVEQCEILDNQGYLGGNLFMEEGRIRNSLIRGGEAGSSGGGLYVRDGAVEQCEIVGNQGNFGGNLFMEAGALRNSLIRDGSAWSEGGGLYLNSSSSVVQQCTVVGNRGVGVCGLAGMVDNCIVVSNESWSGQISNWCGSGVTYRHVCTLPAPSGIGNIDLDPLFLSYNTGDFHLSPHSPCVDAGMALPRIEIDLEGYARPWDGNGDGIVAYDIGAYERGFGTPVTNTPIHYVSPFGGHVPPFARWDSAATNLQAAVNAASPGDLILVTNGVYDTGSRLSPDAYTYWYYDRYHYYSTTTPCRLANRLILTNPVTVRSVNGPAYTLIVGDSSTRCAYVAGGAKLIGFTLKNGLANPPNPVLHDEYGGGALIRFGSVVSGCVVVSNGARCGGGVCNWECSTTESSVLQCNWAMYGGNVYMNCGEAINCLLTGGSGAQGGGAFLVNGRMRHCTLVGNTAPGGGGGACIQMGTIENSILWSNHCGTGGGASTLNWEDFNHGGTSLQSCCTFPLPGGAGCITNAPEFLDESIGDYRLAAQSPCIDAGMTLTNIASDLNGTPRPLDGHGDGVAGYDLGAYEFILGTADTDLDGVTDGDEMDVYFTHPTQADSDEDGMTDGDELTAGFSPLDGQSVFCMGGMHPDSAAPSDGLLVRWSSATGKSYDLLRSTNLTTGFTLYSTNLPATPPLNVYTDATATAGATYFYRVKMGP